MFGLGIGELIFFYGCGTIIGGAGTALTFLIFTKEGREHAKKTICNDLGIGLDEKGQAKLSKKLENIEYHANQQKIRENMHREQYKLTEQNKQFARMIHNNPFM